MRRLRRAVIRYSRLTGPVLGMAVIVCVGGFGLHAAGDWHRHGEIGAGFFHLHFHVGDHDHDDHGHDHPPGDDHDHDTPRNKHRKHTAVLTIAQAMHDTAAAVPAVAPREPAPDRPPIKSVVLPRSSRTASLAKPRAPPV